MASHIVVAKAYFGGRIWDVGEAIELPDGASLPSWVSQPEKGQGTERDAVPAPAPRRASVGGAAGHGADWVKPAG